VGRGGGCALKEERGWRVACGLFASNMTAKATTEPQHYWTVLNERDIKLIRGSGENVTA